MSKDHQIIVTKDQLLVILDALDEYCKIRYDRMECVAANLMKLDEHCRSEMPDWTDVVERQARCADHLHKAYKAAMTEPACNLESEIEHIYPFRAAFAMKAAIECDLEMKAAIECDLESHDQKDVPLDLRPIGGAPDES